MLWYYEKKKETHELRLELVMEVIKTAPGNNFDWYGNISDKTNKRYGIKIKIL